MNSEEDQVIGSSEWIWAKEKDVKAIATLPELLLRDVKFLHSLEQMKKGLEKDAVESGDDLSMLIEIVDRVHDMFDFHPDQKATGMDWKKLKEEMYG